ncbi:hypothetical protein [Streptomyces sp. NPDC088915]|uniref:hypothetical protein n=1 Tax=Streptomyces sp. NPDC088915 TaxID=3365912 RepID=UPI0037F70055
MRRWALPGSPALHAPTALALPELPPVRRRAAAVDSAALVTATPVCFLLLPVGPHALDRTINVVDSSLPTAIPTPTGIALPTTAACAFPS